MNSVLPLLGIACGTLLLPLPANAQTAANGVADASDYVWGFPIETEGDASFYSLQLPIEVNRSVTDAQLRDAGVFNAQGQAVPRVFAPARDGFEEHELHRWLPILPLYANELEKDEVVDVLLRRSGDETTLQFRLDGGSNASPLQQLAAYIVDARELDAAIAALDFEWASTDAGFIGDVMVDASNDLRQWRSVGSAAIADLREDSSIITQRRVKLDNAREDFLRIRWADLPDDWRLSGVDAVYKTSTTRIAREFLRLDPASVDAEDGGLVFDIGGEPLIDRLQLLLTERNVVITATVFSWSESAGRWTRLLNGTFHHVGRDGRAVVSEPVAVGPLRTSRLKVLVERGQQDAPLQLELGWRPDTLLFLAQGNPPYVLAAGRAEDRQQGFPQQRIFGVDAITDLAAKNGDSGTATLGPRYPLGGKLPQSVSPPLNWPQLALWLGLALGVAFVAYMAFRIIRGQ